MQWIKNLYNKVKPLTISAATWVVRTLFECLKLTGLAYMVLHLVVSARPVEIAITAIVVYASVHFTRSKA